MRKNSDAGTARVAERMINLSSHGANAEDIFPHANVKNARRLGRETKNRENNPMHSSRRVRQQ